MRAILDGDRIVKFCLDGGVEATYKDRKKIRVENGLLTTAAPAKTVNRERLIQEKIREIAIRELEKEGKLEAGEMK